MKGKHFIMRDINNIRNQMLFYILGVNVRVSQENFASFDQIGTDELAELDACGLLRMFSGDLSCQIFSIPLFFPPPPCSAMRMQDLDCEACPLLLHLGEHRLALVPSQAHSVSHKPPTQ